MTRRAAAAAGALLLVFSASQITAAHATSYRYWTYWQGTGGTWQFASVGPASSVPADGAVEGWRFAVTEGVRGQGQEPRIAVSAAFRQFCGTREVSPGQKRVAVVFDFGEATDAPDGQSPPAPKGVCVVTTQTANGAAVLSQAATIRTDRGLVCAIAGYPQGECAPALSPSPQPVRAQPTPAEVAADEAPQPTRRPTPTSTPTEVSSDRSAPAEKSQSPAADPESDPATGTTGGSRSGSEPDEPGKTRSTTPPDQSTVAPTPATTASALPVFVEADAAVTQPTGGSWLPMAAVAAIVAALGGFVWWRRRL